MREWKFVVTVQVEQQAYLPDGTLSIVWPSNIAEHIECAIWKTFANPERKTAGILSVSSVVAHRESDNTVVAHKEFP